MSMMVQATTDQVPELADLIAHRRATGEDRFDEWWQGVYRIVTGPSPEHGEFAVQLTLLLAPRVESRGLRLAAPVNIGIDKRNARAPDLGVYRDDTRRTSAAFLSTAELVVEILSPGESPGEKLPFYAEWNVREYLEIDLATATSRLLVRRDGAWTPVDASDVIDLSVAEVDELLVNSRNQTPDS